MKPYYQEDGVTIYCGDARELVGQFLAEAIITDPVWPNSVFPSVADPQALLADVLERASAARVVIHLGCDSDPRFLAAVPQRWRFFRQCDLEYAQCSYKGRLLYTGDVAYVFGNPPVAKPGAMVLPGHCLSTHGDQAKRLTGKHKHHTLQAEAYKALPHPAPRHLHHVRWLCKWFAGESVLDPFGGTGTTAIACKVLGIPCTLIEIEERYCEIAAKRLSQGVLELTEASQ